jgi:hypothetical protein
MKKEAQTVVMAILVAASLGAGYLAGGGGRGVQTVTTSSVVTQTNTTTVTIDPIQAVTSAYLAHLRSIQYQNDAALTSEYEDNATLAFSGGRLGQYRGAVEIRSVYQDVFFVPNGFGFSTVNLANESWTVSPAGSGTEATISSNFTMFGNDTSLIDHPGGVCATYTTNVSLQISYVLSGNDWLISQEAWDFGGFYVSQESC